MKIPVSTLFVATCLSVVLRSSEGRLGPHRKMSKAPEREYSEDIDQVTQSPRSRLKSTSFSPRWRANMESLPEFDISSLREQVARAVSSGQRTATIPEGVYRGQVEDNVFITIEGAKNLTIEAENVFLVCEKLTRAIGISNAENLIIRGLTIDYDPLPFTQGTIIAVDPNDTWVDVQIHIGYPSKAYDRIDIVDPTTRHRKHGMPFLWGTTAQVSSNGIVRVSREEGFGGSATVGDLASMSTGPDADGIPHGIDIMSSRGVSLQDVTVHAAPGFAIVNGGGYGDHHYDKVRVIPGPKPPGASEERLLSSSWDAIQFNDLRKGPIVENCVVISAGDDSWSLSSRDYLLLAAEGRKAWLVYRIPYNNFLEVGDHLARSLDSPKPRITSVTSVEVADVPISAELRSSIETAEPYTFYQFEMKNLREVQLDMDVPWPAGTSLYSPDRNCAGFILRNNTFHSPGRAGLINGASKGVIEGNTYIDVHAAISLYPNTPAGAGMGTQDIVFRNNTVLGTGNFCPSPWSLVGGAVNIHHTAPVREPAAAGAFRSIVIENNHFAKIRGPVFVITSVEGLTIRGNRLVDIQQEPDLGGGRDWGVDGTAVGWFQNTANVTLTGNEIQNRGQYGGPEYVGLT